MNTRLLFTLLIVLSIKFPGGAQEQMGPRQAVGLSIITNHTKPLIIQKNFNSPLADLTSKSIAGFEGRLDYWFRITPRFYLEAGLILGVNPYRFDLFVSEDFAGLPWGDHNDFYKEYADSPYVGASLGLNYAFPLGQKSEVVAGVGFNYIYYIGVGSSSYGIGYQVDPNTHISIFSMSTTSNPETVLFFPVELKVRYNYHFGNHFLLSGFLNWIPSNRTILTGTYTILGANNSFTGTIEKRSGRAGFGIGGYYLF